MALVTAAAEVTDYLASVGSQALQRAGRAPGASGHRQMIGLFFPCPSGLSLGPFLEALMGELLSGRSMQDSVRAGLGGLLGTLSSMVVKFAVAVAMTVAFVVKVV